ncbi:type II toxin-antitoxin system RatA family toxin [Tropicimonas sp. IMCC6043]|uniref:type II toxin-antitoxin system RatA family toxin n=1 Tax=Tropicimonas sp. IMCC6043 TaxID=2510645 RepID=UPI00101D630B|nr:type II toxin-antitoxin system RatA family toxin [Tropicimonas sp. IMCC6043]RYH10304.1 type II toxin-antitoxin system RatA family toxin [Tropicimonas sp. IMCC6043]
MHSFSDKRVMPYTAQQMFDLVADIESYPKFLPWTAAARMRDRRRVGDAELALADMVISFKVFRETFRTKVTMKGDGTEKTIVSENVEGLFRHLVSTWTFREIETGCEVDYHIDFEFRNRILQKTAGVFFTEAQRQIMGAFQKRAETLYG